MNESYTLQPSNTVFNFKDNFPQLDNDKKIGIFLSGGMESSLLVILAQHYYGKDNVLCFYSDSIFCENKEEKKTYIKTNIDRAKANLDIDVIYLDFDYDLHVSNRRESILQNITKIQDQYNVQYVLFGFTKLFFEVEVFKQDGLTTDDVHRIANSDPLKYKGTIEEFHLPTDEYTKVLLDIDIPPEVYPLLRHNDTFIRSPLYNLNKAEVVDFYNQLGILDKLYKTSSCILHHLTTENKHCGYCFNCQQRSDAFSILNNENIKDETEYSMDLVQQRRKHLLEVMNASNT